MAEFSVPVIRSPIGGVPIQARPVHHGGAAVSGLSVLSFAPAGRAKSPRSANGRFCLEGHLGEMRRSEPRARLRRNGYFVKTYIVTCRGVFPETVIAKLKALGVYRTSVARTTCRASGSVLKCWLTQ